MTGQAGGFDVDASAFEIDILLVEKNLETRIFVAHVDSVAKESGEPGMGGRWGMDRRREVIVQVYILYYLPWRGRGWPIEDKGHGTKEKAGSRAVSSITGDFMRDRGHLRTQ